MKESLTTEDVYARACELLQTGHAEEAVELFDFLTQIAPEAPIAHWMKGVALSNLSRHEEAAQATRAGLELEPGDVMATWNLALSLSHLEKLDEAIELLGETYQAHPDFFDALFLMGHLHAQRKDQIVDGGFKPWVRQHEKGRFDLQSALDHHLYILGLLALGEAELAQGQIPDLREMNATRAAHVESIIARA